MDTGWMGRCEQEMAEWDEGKGQSLILPLDSLMTAFINVYEK